MKYKYTFIVSLSKENKSGLFNSAANRIKQFVLNNEDIEVYNLRSYDGCFLRLFKKIFKRKILNPLQSFVNEGIEYKSLNIKISLMAYFLEKANLHYLLYFYYAYKNRKKIKGTSLLIAHWGLNCGTFAYWIGRFLKIKTVVNYHGSDIHTIPMKSKGWMFTLSKILSSVNGNVFVSKTLYAKALEINKINNPKIIYNGLDRSIYNQLPDSEIREIKKKNELTDKVIGFVGNLVSIKNADYLPEIFLEIQKKSNQNISFLIIGDGVLRKKIQSRISKYKLKIIFTGRITSKEVAKYMNCMDLLILPSKNEGFPLVTWEALSCGSQCIGSRVGGIPEAIGNENTVELNESFIEKFSDLALLKINSIKQSIDTTNIITWGNVYEQEIEFYHQILNFKF